MSSNLRINVGGNSGGGIGIAGVLTVVFVALKLLHVQPVAGWDWIWVFSPLWISFLLGVALFIIFGVIYLLIAAAQSSAQARRYSPTTIRYVGRAKPRYQGLPNNEKALHNFYDQH